jgi:hypothetical protein
MPPEKSARRAVESPIPDAAAPIFALPVRQPWCWSIAVGEKCAAA